MFNVYNQNKEMYNKLNLSFEISSCSFLSKDEFKKLDPSLDKNAIAVLKEIDTDDHTTPESHENFNSEEYQYAITLCGCVELIDDKWKKNDFRNWNLDNPPDTDKGDLQEYRRVRDEVITNVNELFESIKIKYKNM